MRIRSPHLVVAGATGIAVGVLLYRFSTLGLLARDGLRLVLPCIAAVLIGAGAVLHVLDTRGRHLQVSHRIATAIASIGVATSVIFFVIPSLRDRMTATEHTPLVRKALPGFSIEVPATTPSREHVEYGAGTLEYRFLDKETIKVLWSPATPDERQIELTLAVVANELRTEREPVEIAMPGPRGIPARTMGLDVGPEGMMRLSQLTCGTRMLQVMTVGHAEIEDRHRRILASIECTPDPIQETASDPVRIVLELRGWTAMTKARRVRLLTDGSARLMLTEGTLRHVPVSKIAEALPVILEANGVEVISKVVQDDRVWFEGTIAGDPVVGWARMLSCDTHSVMLVGSARTAKEAQAVAMATRNAHCVGEREEPSDWPDAPAEPPESVD